MAQEVQSPVGSVAITWAAVGSTPVVGGDASGLARIRLTRKALLKELTLRFSGTYDQTVGAETQATEGNPVLITNIQLDVNGRKIRLIGGGGGLLYEINRIVNQGAGPKIDPVVGVAAAKLFSSTLFYQMSEYDAKEEHVSDLTLLDLANFDNVFLEVQFGPFNRYAAGNTQTNMAATLAVDELDILGVRRLPQFHFEPRKVQVTSLVNAQIDAALDLVRRKTVTRALLIRYGTLSSTPIVLGQASLTQVQVKGTLNQGTTQDLKQKMPIASYQQTVGVGRNGIALLAGYIEMDFANNRKASGKIVGENYTDLRLLFDNTALALGSMEVYQLTTAR